ncbi:hypothetical protein [Helicobacter cetorum]|uniref:Uncharacterized protein n=1 Tax=Helicobacter cetorum (strain ATCC BAA-540 / CCUG 52418 / MIT 99-5656) TaxID=1163745 RepID=I0ER58_HELCM|nr:hypothetical protein [Helicobacter cetorum]AFI05427.1 hypothetical protein HCD_02015 [Helicobacter cetorum MIT 99-5656]
MSSGEIKLFSSRPWVSSVSDGIIEVAIRKRVFASTMKSLFGESMFIKQSSSALSKSMVAPLEHHQHSFAKKYENALNGCQKHIKIHVPTGSSKNLEHGAYTATLLFSF